MGKIYKKVFIPVPIEKCWDFFSSPENLSKITPPQMSFRLKDFDGQPIYLGQIIKYKVSPIPRIRMSWHSKIVSLTPGRQFADIQLKGPYSKWHHRHILEKHENGTNIIDMVHYKVPLGILGVFIDKLFISRKLKNVFEFRQTVLLKLLSD